MSLAIATPTAVTLRCHRCSHAVGESPVALQIVGLFKLSALGKIGRTHGMEVRKRCPSCGWVNLFHPETRSSAIELK